MHPLTVDHNEQEYDLLGDIFHMRFYFIYLHLYVNCSLQITPVLIDFLHPSPPLTPPVCARLTIICKCGYMLTDVDTFHISLSKVVQDAPECAHLCVHAWPKHPGWLPIPLLFPNVMAKISGTILMFRHRVLLILVDEIANWPPRTLFNTILTHGDMEVID